MTSAGPRLHGAEAGAMSEHCRCLCHVNHAAEMRRQASELLAKAADLQVTARADIKALEEQAAGLLQRAEAEESGPT